MILLITIMVLSQRCYILILLVSFNVLFIYFYTHGNLSVNTLRDDYYQTQDEYLINSPTCRIINLNPWNKDAKTHYVKLDYYTCPKKYPIITEMQLDPNGIDTYILYHKPTKEIAFDYSNQSITCTMSQVLRNKTKLGFNDSQIILIEDQLLMAYQTKVSNEHPTYIACTQRNQSLYREVHMPIALTHPIRTKLRNFNLTMPARPLSILILGIDSVSRLNLIRTMPKTYNYLRKDPAWLEFKVFQKMHDNTFPNLMALLTGYNKTQAMEICRPKELGGLDACDLIWRRYAARNFITAYAEDLAGISTFNYLKEGFNTPPTDYYMRAYHLACKTWLQRKSLDNGAYCYGGTSEGERIWNLAQDFARLHASNPYFGFFWTNGFSHESVNTPGRMDSSVRAYLTEILRLVKETTMIVFLSDHGIRFGAIRHTFSGYLEERLPFLHIHLPKWFRRLHTTQYATLRHNQERMVTPYDLYMTLQDVLTLNDPSYKVQPSMGCPKCKSLLRARISLNRTCADANVTDHWCACANLQRVPTTAAITAMMETVVGKLNALIQRYQDGDRCAVYRLHRIINLFRAAQDQSVHLQGGDLYVVQFETNPSAMFEVSVRAGEIYGGFSRADSYKSTAWCTRDASLMLLCACQR